MKLDFKKIRWQNFLSTGNVFTEIQLNRSKSTMIVGENGAGKSTLLDALLYVLYGKPFRNINKPQLVNSITKKDLLVEIEFSTGGKEYLVRRGMKPNIFEIIIDGKLLNQSASVKEYQDLLEKNILQMNTKSFSQIVVLGSANYMPFMQLPAQHRREVIEDLLDIQIFSVMNSLLKTKIADNKTSISDTDYRIALCEQKLDMHRKHLDGLKQNNDAIIKHKEGKIKEHQERIAQIDLELSARYVEISDLSSTITGFAGTFERNKKLVDTKKALEDRIKKLTKEIAFYQENDNCPTCHQGIEHNFKSTVVSTKETKIDEVNAGLEKLDISWRKVLDRLDQISEVQRQINELNATIADLNKDRWFATGHIAELAKELALLNKPAETRSNNVTELYTINAELSDFKKQKEQLVNSRELYEVSGYLLKDGGIKSKIIRQYIPIMNKIINKYLASMNFFVNFELDDSFNETIKSRGRDDFTYSSFSEGEKARLDLALMFTWRALAKLRNSASTNLLILDEVFDSSLDTAGNDYLTDILDLHTDGNVFVISHKSTGRDKFHSIIEFTKHKNFSRIEQ